MYRLFLISSHLSVTLYVLTAVLVKPIFLSSPTYAKILNSQFSKLRAENQGKTHFSQSQGIEKTNKNRGINVKFTLLRPQLLQRFSTHNLLNCVLKIMENETFFLLLFFYFLAQVRELKN